MERYPQKSDRNRRNNYVTVVKSSVVNEENTIDRSTKALKSEIPALSRVYPHADKKNGERKKNRVKTKSETGPLPRGRGIATPFIMESSWEKGILTKKKIECDIVSQLPQGRQGGEMQKRYQFEKVGKKADGYFPALCVYLLILSNRHPRVGGDPKITRL